MKKEEKENWINKILEKDQDPKRPTSNIRFSGVNRRNGPSLCSTSSNEKQPDEVSQINAAIKHESDDNAMETTIALRSK